MGPFSRQGNNSGVAWLGMGQYWDLSFSPVLTQPSDGELREMIEAN